MKKPVNLMTELSFAKINAKYKFDELKFRHDARREKKRNTIRKQFNFAKDTFNNTVDMYAENGSDVIGKHVPNVFKAAAKAYRNNRSK